MAANGTRSTGHACPDAADLHPPRLPADLGGASPANPRMPETAPTSKDPPLRAPPHSFLTTAPLYVGSQALQAS